MIRTPTPDPYAWWRCALADPMTPRTEIEPHAGFYARRAIRGGPLLPVEVRLHQAVDPETGELTEPETFQAFELGQSKDPTHIWTSLRPITEAQYHELIERHRTDQRMTATHVAIDISETPMRPTRGSNYA